MLQFKSLSPMHFSVPRKVDLIGAGMGLLDLDDRDLSPTPATETAAPRIVMSEARVTRDAGEDIVGFGGLIDPVVGMYCN